MKRLALLLILLIAPVAEAQYRQVKAGSTSVILGDLVILDSTSTVGAGKTALAYNTSSLTCYYHRNTANASVAVTLATMTLGTFTSGGFKEVDATNMPGVYQFCPPDAALAAGAQAVSFVFRGATGMVEARLQVELTATDVQDGVRAGLTSLPNAAAEAAGGLITRGTSTGQLTVSSGNVTVGGYASGQVPLQPTVDGRKLLVSATGYSAIDWGMIDNKATGNDFSNTWINRVDNVPNGVDVASVDGSALAATNLKDFGLNGYNSTAHRTYSDARSILGTALTETSGGYLAAGFKKLFDVAAPVFTMASVNQTVDASTIKTVTDKLNTAVELDGSVYRLTTNALELAPTGGGGGGGCSGSGGVAQTVTLVTAASVPIADARVWITTDSAGTNIIAGPLYTNAFGKATFMLDAGVYYRWAMKSGVSFTNPRTLTVVAP